MKNIADLTIEIELLSELKDNAVKRAEYDEAASIRDQMDELKLEMVRSMTPSPAHRDLTGGCPPADTMNSTRIGNLKRIAEMTDCKAPGIYDSKVIEEVNSLARNALALPTVSSESWSHNTPPDPDAPKAIHWEPVSSRIIKGRVAEALDKLSGTMSHDNVAAAKQILKKIVD